jgi:hypothetical protein
MSTNSDRWKFADDIGSARIPDIRATRTRGNPDFAVHRHAAKSDDSGLFEFIFSERFRRKTKLPMATVTDALTLPVNNEKRKRAANQFPVRQIANAMAGVPDIGWRRSI